MANNKRDPKTGRLLPKSPEERKKRARQYNAAKDRKAAREASRELAAMVGELLPADYEGQVPAGADLSLIEGPRFALEGGKILAERGTKVGKLSKSNRQLEWKSAINWAIKN